jgi:hypothetical protein
MMMMMMMMIVLGVLPQHAAEIYRNTVPLQYRITPPSVERCSKFQLPPVGVMMSLSVSF